MDRRKVLTGSALTALALASLSRSAMAEQRQPQPAPQPPKPMKELIVGTWNLLIIDGIKADGTRVPLYGPNPKGMAMFSADGHYFLSNMRDVRKKFATNDRLRGTPEEIKAAFESGLTHFGSYVLNEADKTITLHIEGCSFPNWEGTTQKRKISALVGDDFVWSNTAGAAPSLDTPQVELVFRRAKAGA